MLALAVGFGIGLLVGNWVVRVIETPLTEALETYYEEDAVDRIEKKLAERRAAGESIPEVLNSREAIKKIVIGQKLLFEEHFVMLDEVVDELKRQDPNVFGNIQLTPVPAEPADKAGRADQEAAPGKAADPAAPGHGPDQAAAAKPAPTPRFMRIYLWHHITDDDRVNPKSLGVQETFMLYIKAAFIAGAIISSPLVFYFLWSFVAAGLYPHEKRYVRTFLPASVGLFLFGAFLAFFFVFKPVLEFLFSFNHSMGIDPDPRISEWLSFVLLLPLGFGVSFQLPLIMLFLERIGIFTVESYLSKWKIAVLAIAIASMVLSPGGDPYSMMMMFVPLTFLYFGGVAACYYMPGPRNRPSSA